MGVRGQVLYENARLTQTLGDSNRLKTTVRRHQGRLDSGLRGMFEQATGQPMILPG